MKAVFWPFFVCGNILISTFPPCGAMPCVCRCYCWTKPRQVSIFCFRTKENKRLIFVQTIPDCSSHVGYSPDISVHRLYIALDAESEHMVQEAIDHMLSAGREGGNGNTGTRDEENTPVILNKRSLKDVWRRVYISLLLSSPKPALTI